MKNLDEIKNSSLMSLFVDYDEHGRARISGKKFDDFLKKCPSFTEEKLNDFMSESWTCENGVNLFKEIINLVKGMPESEEEAIQNVTFKIRIIDDFADTCDALSNENKEQIHNKLSDIANEIEALTSKKKQEAKIDFDEALGDLLWLAQDFKNTPSQVIYNKSLADFVKRQDIIYAVDEFIEKVGKNGFDMEQDYFINFILDNDPFVKDDKWKISNAFFDRDENSRGISVYSALTRYTISEVANDLYNTRIKNYIEANVLDEKELENFVNGEKTTQKRKQ